MNWTGGRLRRHSHNKPGSLSRIQKQHFAKARLKLQKESHQASQVLLSPHLGGPCRPLVSRTRSEEHPQESQVKKSRNEGKKLEGRSSHELPYHSIKRFSSNRHSRSFEDLSRLRYPEDEKTRQHPVESGDTEKFTRDRPGTSSQLDVLKRRLLQKGDWATISVSRPLRMAFVSVEERERIGKRRRITEDDRRRQAVPAPRVISPEFYTRKQRITCRDEAGENDTLGNISIRINGFRPGAAQKGSSQKPFQSQESSESMLLDREEAVYLDRTVNPRARSSEPRRHCSVYDRSSQMLDSMAYDLFESSYIDSEHLPVPTRLHMSDAISSQHIPSDNLTDSSSHQNHRSPRSTSLESSQKGPVQDSLRASKARELPVCNRFTLDDQVLAEKEGKLNDHSFLFGNQDVPTRGPEHNPDSFIRQSTSRSGISKKGIVDSLTDIRSPSSNQQSGRLPATRHKIFRSLGPAETTRPRLASDAAETQRPPFLTSALSLLEASGHITPMKERPQISVASAGSLSKSPAKFFGQPIAVSPELATKEDDYWMRFVLGPDSGTPDMTDDMYMNEARGQLRPAANTGTPEFGTNRSILEKRSDAPCSDVPFSTQPSIQTSANTWLNIRERKPSDDENTQPSETDFLSHLSPMRGLIDESLTQISLHNNAPRTIHPPTFASTSVSSPANELNKTPSVYHRPHRQSPYFAKSSFSPDHISIQNQPKRSSVSAWTTSSPDPLSMSATAFRQRPSVRGNQHMVFRNIHADEPENVPFFRTPFRR